MNKNLFFKTTIVAIILIFISCSSDDNSSITVTTEDFSTTMDENPVNAQVIGIVQGSTNEGSIRFSITEQNPSGAFAINPVSGELKVADASLFKFEMNPVISGSVKVANADVFENSRVTITLNKVITEKTYEGTVFLRSQQELNDFGANDYTYITKSLWIGTDRNSSDIYDLSPLQSLKKIGHDLTIYDNPNLTTTSGLSINHIGKSFSIHDNTSLTTVEGFNNLTSIPGGLIIRDNPVLTDLTSLSQITSAGSISLTRCAALPNLEWLSNLTSLTYTDGLAINSCNSLTHIDGLRNLTNISNSLIFFYENPSLENLDGLQNVNASIKYLFIHGNPSLLKINGLENIEVTKSIRITENPLLQSLRGLEKTTNISRDIYIKENNSIINLEGLNNLTLINNIFNISENGSLISLSGLENVSTTWWLNVLNNSQLIDLCALQNLFLTDPQSNFEVSGNAYNPSAQDIIDGNCRI